MTRALAGFRFMLASRGWRRGFYRSRLIWRRFGLTRRRMVHNLRRLLEVLEEHDARATLFVPATVLADHRRALAAFRSPRLEWGVHSDFHTDLSRMTPAEQRAHIANAVRLFSDCGWPFRGFRAPYLKTNDATATALAAAGGFLYDSSPCVLWDEVYDASRTSYGWIRDFYRPELHSRRAAAVDRDGPLVRIPVSLPDDDVLVDRDQCDTERVYAVWSAILERCHQAGEIFVLQLHPERADELAGVLSRLLARARALSPPMWLPTLGEVAERAARGETGWPEPCAGAFCVTGDLDAMAVGDFLRRLRSW